MKKGLFIAILAVLLGGYALPADATSIVNCSFNRTLSMGSWGEDVRCLQSYLSGAGFGYTYPDGNYGSLTFQAVASWQAANGLQPTGVFDSQSRTVYIQLTGGSVLGWNSPNSSESKALERINAALVMIRDADEAIDDSRRNTDKAEDLLDDAKADATNAVKSFMSGNFSKAINSADDAYDNALDARNRANSGSSGGGSKGDKGDAKEAIDDAEDAIDDAEDDIKEARRDGKNVSRAEDLLDDAKDALDDAEDEYDDGDYDDAEDSAKDAEELADDAVDAIGSSGTVNDRTRTLNAIEDVEDDLNDAWDDVEEADDDGIDTDDAEDLLEDAEDAIDDARIEFNKTNYSKAMNFVEDAEDLIDDALEEID